MHTINRTFSIHRRLSNKTQTECAIVPKLCSNDGFLRTNEQFRHWLQPKKIIMHISITLNITPPTHTHTLESETDRQTHIRESEIDRQTHRQMERETGKRENIYKYAN